MRDGGEESVVLGSAVYRHVLSCLGSAWLDFWLDLVDGLVGFGGCVIEDPVSEVGICGVVDMGSQWCTRAVVVEGGAWSLDVGMA